MDKKEMIEGLESIRDSFDINTPYHKFVVQEAINNLKAKTAPVADVPCSGGLANDKAEIGRLRYAVERLGSMEDFTISRAVDKDRELMSRIDYARRVLEG